MRFNVLVRDKDNVNSHLPTEAPGSRDAIKKIKKKFPHLEVIKAEKVD